MPLCKLHSLSQMLATKTLHSKVAYTYPIPNDPPASVNKNSYIFQGEHCNRPIPETKATAASCSIATEYLIIINTIILQLLLLYCFCKSELWVTHVKRKCMQQLFNLFFMPTMRQTLNRVNFVITAIIHQIYRIFLHLMTNLFESSL